MSYLEPRGGSRRRLAGIVFAAVIHVVIAYALVTGLARKVVEVIRQPLETRIIEEAKPPPPKPPPPLPPPPKMAAPPPPFVPPPEIRVAVPPPPPWKNCLFRKTIWY